MPKVSVIIASYNHEKYVAESIQSVLDQTYQDFEIIITDDGSSDRTVSMIEQFRDPRIKLFAFTKNQGASIAANHCIKNASGEFIALLNSDDSFHKEKLEKQVDFLDSHPAICAVFSQAQFIGENNQPLAKINYIKKFNAENKNRFEWLNYFFYNGNCLCHPSILIRKECYETIGLYDPRLAQLPDFDFWIRLLQKYEIFILSEKLINFRIRDREANASADSPKKNARLSFELFQVFQHYLTPTILDNVSKIFPELTNLPDNLSVDRDIAAFVIAREASVSSIPSLRFWGLHTLYKLLDPTSENYRIFETYFDFNYIDFIQKSGDKGIFITPQASSTLELIKNSKLWRLWNIWIQVKEFMQIQKKH